MSDQSNTTEKVDNYSLLTLTDGQQLLVPNNDFIKVEVGVVTDEGTFTIDTREDITATTEEYTDLLDQAMTNAIEVDTITGKAQAVNNDVDTEINDTPPHYAKTEDEL